MNLSNKNFDSLDFRNLLCSNILQIINDSIIVTNMEGVIVYWNQGDEQIFGYTQKEALGKHTHMLFPEIRNLIPKVDLQKIIQGQDYIGERKGERKDGREVWVNIKITTLRDSSGNVIGLIGISRDITEQKQMVRELIQSEAKYQTIFENSGEGFFLMDDKFIDVNKKACEILGLKKQEIIGKSPLDFSPEMQADGSNSANKKEYYIKKALEEGSVSFYWRHLNKLKEVIETRITLNRVRIQGKNFLISIMHDMTEMIRYQESLKSKTKELAIYNDEILLLNEELNETNARLQIINKQIELNERKFRSAFETSPDAVNINRLSDGLFVEINEGFTNFLGYTKDDVEGKTSLELNLWVNDEDRKKMVQGVIKKNHFLNLEMQFRKKDGSVTTVLTSASKIEINNEMHILSLSRDISERKKYEDKLKEAMKKAEESDMLKSAFLANMSHEIRTPMNAILGFSQLLKEKKVDHVKQDKFLDIIITRSKNLLQIINDIIDISKIEANQLNIEMQEVSLNKILHELVSHYEAEMITLDKNAVNLVFKTDGNRLTSHILSDELRLKQILTNLIGNAIKFTEKGEIEIGYNIKGSNLEFFVKDTGVGIPSEALEQIFKRFRQADDSSTREFGGTGLGLSISKQLVELLGGKIWVNSEINKGSCFNFTIPFNPVTIPKLTQEKENESSLNLLGKNILIVEDDLISMAYLIELLENTKANILKAENGIDAIEIFKSAKKVDLVLMDMNMPQMNGNIATQEMKKINKSVPVIVQSAFAMPNDKKESFKYGCDDYITKPIDSRLLISILKKFLG